MCCKMEGGVWSNPTQEVPQDKDPAADPLTYAHADYS